MKNQSLILSLFFVSSTYCQQPPTQSLTLKERNARAWSAYRACEVQYHKKCMEYYEEKSEQGKQEKCRMMEHMQCWKVYQEKLTEGFYEEVKESFGTKQ